MNLEIKIALLAFILSAFYSGSESVFYSAHRIKIEVLRRRKIFGANWVAKYLDHPERYLSTILVGNNIANVLFGSFTAIYLSRFFNELEVSIISAGVILIFAEIIPKTVLRAVAEPASLRLVYLVRLSEIVFWPVIRILSLLSEFLSQLLDASPEGSRKLLSKEDIRLLFRESRYLGHLQLKDEELVRRIMRLGNVQARQIMVPR
ncbi:MAG: DUF21 domain-containing protein, partial [Calditrichaeota bacterium]